MLLHSREEKMMRVEFVGMSILHDINPGLKRSSFFLEIAGVTMSSYQNQIPNLPGMKVCDIRTKTLTGARFVFNNL